MGYITADICLLSMRLDTRFKTYFITGSVPSPPDGPLSLMPIALAKLPSGNIHVPPKKYVSGVPALLLLKPLARDDSPRISGKRTRLAAKSKTLPSPFLRTPTDIPDV